MRSSPGLLFFLLLPLLAPDAVGHGAAYRGPALEKPDASSTPPPGGDGKGRRPVPALVDVRLWETWWGYNKDAHFPAPPQREGQGAGWRREAVAALTPLAQPGNELDIRDSAVLALGRVGDGRETKLLGGFATDKKSTVRESAILALGLLRDPDAERLLVTLANDRQGSATERGLALVALGFSGQAVAQEELLRSIDPDEARARAAHLAPLRALTASMLPATGVGPDRRHPAAGRLAEEIRSPDHADELLIPVALGALGLAADHTAVPVALAALGDRRHDVRAGAALALGSMITSPEGDILKRLHKALTQEGDILPRRFLLIALGHMGGEGAQRILLREHAHKDRQHRAFAALGLALSNHGGSIPAFREALLAARDVSLRGVYAIALGLLGDRGAVPVLADMLTKERNPEIQTHLIEALTLLRATAALPLVERLLRESRDPHVRVAAARAIGLLGSDEQGRQLVDLLASGSMTEDALGGLAMGIGLRRDPALAGPLLEVAGNASRSRLVRAFAITALGILADPLPPQGIPPSPFSRLTAGAHYGVRIDVLDALRALY